MTSNETQPIPGDLRSPAVLGEVVCAFTAPIRPQPKERPRVYGGRGITPERTRVFEQAIAMCAQAAMKGRTATGEPVRAIILAEQRDLLPPHDDEWALLRGVEPCRDPIHPWPPESARLAFLQRYHELTQNKETAV